MSDKDKSLELKKHVGTIHSHNKLTLVQRKIANALLYNAYDELLCKDEHKIHITSLCELIGYDSKDYKSIKKALMVLISTVIEWNLIDKDRLEVEGIWNASSIIADASICGPICTYSYSKKMRELLYRPELYGRINMSIQARFKSAYGLVLYENCIRYQNINQTPWFDMSLFRKLMGVEEHKYTIFRDFKRRVLDKSIQEVNEYSPISIMPNFKKSGCQVVAIQFFINRSEKLFLDKPDVIKQGEKLLLERLQQDFGFSKAQTEHVIALYDEHYILEKISIIESSQSFQKGKIINLAKYLENALEQNYKSAKSSKVRIEQSYQEKKVAVEIHKQKEEKIEKYRQFQDRQILQLYASCQQKQKMQLEKQFEAYIKGSIYHNLFHRDGLTNILVADRFCEFIRVHRQDLLVNQPTSAEFNV